MNDKLLDPSRQIAAQFVSYTSVAAAGVSVPRLGWISRFWRSHVAEGVAR